MTGRRKIWRDNPNIWAATTPPQPSTRPGDLDEKGIADLRKVFPKAIARIKAEERQRMVAEIRKALSDVWPASDNPTAVGITWDRINAALDATEGRESGEPDDAQM